MLESLSYLTHAFPIIVELGAQGDFLKSALATRPGTARYLTCATLQSSVPAPNLLADEEWLPFAQNSLDAVVSLLTLHWVNDLPGCLAQIRQALRPDGLFMAMLPGGETLQELRASFAAVESRRQGGLTPRVAPLIDVRDGGALLQRAGFALPVADSEKITITYPHLFALMADLRGTAQTNMLRGQVQHFTARGLLNEVAQHYAEHYGEGEGGIRATIELVTLTGWKPAATQQQPAKRGSGQISLTQILQ